MLGRAETTKTQHRVVSFFHAAVILLDPSIQVGAAAVFHFGTRASRIARGSNRGHHWLLHAGPFAVTDTAPLNRWAAAMSRVTLSMESTRLPSRSIARYR